MMRIVFFILIVCNLTHYTYGQELPKNWQFGLAWGGTAGNYSVYINRMYKLPQFSFVHTKFGVSYSRYNYDNSKWNLLPLKTSIGVNFKKFHCNFAYNYLVVFERPGLSIQNPSYWFRSLYNWEIGYNFKKRFYLGLEYMRLKRSTSDFGDILLEITGHDLTEMLHKNQKYAHWGGLKLGYNF
jgi:hypothetical protein